MRKISEKELIKKIKESIILASHNVDNSCALALKNAENKETNPLAKSALKIMNDNIDLAKSKEVPACQDTGMCVVFCEVGNNAYIDFDLDSAINEGVKEGYNTLRKSVVTPLQRLNTKDNTPAVIHYSFKNHNKLKVDVMLKGFGSENMSRLFMLEPYRGVEGVKEVVLQTVKDAGSSPCPPIIIGVGIGGTVEKAALMSKHALLRKVGSLNDDKFERELEEELLDKVNALNIGPQGFKGSVSALRVFIESYPTHITSIPVCVNICCHCSRHESFSI